MLREPGPTASEQQGKPRGQAQADARVDPVCQAHGEPRVDPVCQAQGEPRVDPVRQAWGDGKGWRAESHTWLPTTPAPGSTFRI